MEMNALMMNQKHKREKLLKKNPTFGFIFFVGVGILGPFLIKEEPVKAKKGKIKIKSDSEKKVLNSSIDPKRSAINSAFNLHEELSHLLISWTASFIQTVIVHSE